MCSQEHHRRPALGLLRNFFREKWELEGLESMPLRKDITDHIAD